MAHCIPTYMLASGLMASGMNWSQALVTILLGNTIVLIPILLNSHPGTKYGIPFPVFARAAYGTLGSNVPALMRALVACGWFGIQAWIGGEALHTFFKTIMPGWPTLLGAGFGGHTTTAWLSFLLFWGLNVFIIYRGMDLVREVENWAAPFVLVMTAVLLWWAVSRANGLGPLLAQPGKVPHASREFWPVFVPSLTAMIGFWATLSLNMPDFTRFGRSQREQIDRPGRRAADDDVAVCGDGRDDHQRDGDHLRRVDLGSGRQLVGKFSSPVVVAISMFTVVVATIAVNIAANVVSPANDFANAFPRFISFKTGGLITGIVGIAIQPWRLLADPSGYIYTWLLGYSGGLGSIAGVLVADYWIVRRRDAAPRRSVSVRRRLSAAGTWRAIAATAIGCALAWGGFVVPALKPLYDYALVRRLLRLRPGAPGAGAAAGADRRGVRLRRVIKTRVGQTRRRTVPTPGVFSPQPDLMDLRQLEILQAIAETGSFTACGRKLHVSQSAISRQILLLEEELGEPLFLRVGRQVRMTPAAESLVQLGQRVFLDVRDTVGAITDRTRELRGTLRLSGGMTVCLYVFPPLLKHLRRVHPHLDVRADGRHRRPIGRRRFAAAASMPDC